MKRAQNIAVEREPKILRSMVYLAIAATFLLLGSSCGRDGIPDDHSAANIMSGAFRVVHKKAELPNSVLQFMESRMIGQKSGWADPDEQFQSTDMIPTPRLPIRQLVFCGISERGACVVYKHGGRGLYYCFVVLVFETNSVETKLIGITVEKIDDLATLQSVIRERKFERVNRQQPDNRL